MKVTNIISKAHTRQNGELTESKRLKLIAAAVRYCQHMKKRGMPSNCYTKALREPIYFLWTHRVRGLAKDKLAAYTSKDAMGKRRRNGELVLDHAIPFRLLQEKLLRLRSVTPENVRRLLSQYDVYAVITKGEDRKLCEKELQSEMPVGWDRKDHLARYRAVGIKLVRTELNRRE